MYKVFVDGQEGTTGLKINDYLKKRNDIRILHIDPVKRKDPDERAKLLNEADVAILCLPDTAARESASLVTSEKTCIIDASTAHRTDDEWAYGLPELSAKHREIIGKSNRISVPGCYATGFNVLIYPLVKKGIISSDYPLTCHAVSGYSGGGKKLIGRYEGDNAGKDLLKSPCFYSFALNHKHLPEMTKISGLAHAPIFTPIVGNYFQGMTVAIPLYLKLLNRKFDAAGLNSFYSSYYEGQHFINVIPFGSEEGLDDGFLFATGCNGTNRLDLFVFGNSDRILLACRFDNLGKGASGAAVQNLNIVLGLDEGTGLEG